MNRRTLLQWLVSLSSAVPFLRGRAVAQVLPDLPAEAEATLRALGTLVLPGALGRERQNEIVTRFLVWSRQYRPAADLDHGYGFTRLRATGPSPVVDYPSQLAALEHAARGEGAAFAALTPDRQRVLVEAALVAAKVDALPSRPDGRHVAADLMSFFFRSSQANDLCYRAQIGRDTCRGLPGSEDPPAPLGGGG